MLYQPCDSLSHLPALFLTRLPLSPHLASCRRPAFRRHTNSLRAHHGRPSVAAAATTTGMWFVRPAGNCGIIYIYLSLSLSLSLISPFFPPLSYTHTCRDNTTPPKGLSSPLSLTHTHAGITPHHPRAFLPPSLIHTHMQG